MFTHRHYVPILKWKQGEYQALSRLSNVVKDNLTPTPRNSTGWF